MHIYIFIYLYEYVPDEGSLMPKYRDCTMPNGLELYFLWYEASFNNYICRTNMLGVEQSQYYGSRLPLM